MAYGDVTRKALDLLEQLGPMTAKELSIEMDMHVNNVSMVLTRCTRRGKYGDKIKRVYIHSWAMELINSNGKSRTVPRRVFAVGDKKNAVKPKPKDCATRCKEWRENKKGKANNIFTMGKRDTNGLFQR